MVREELFRGLRVKCPGQLVSIGFWLAQGGSSRDERHCCRVESQVLWKDGFQELLAGQDFGLVRMRAILWKPGGSYIPLV